MLEDYCNQTATWKHVIGTDGYTQAIYDSEVEIACRIEDKIKLVRDKTGTQVVSSTTIYTPSLIKLDDIVNGRVVIAVQNLTGLDGEIEGYTVYLI